MALKITTQIGTDKGITSEAYVRITDYQISKYGYANFRTELFQSQADATSNENATFPNLASGTARNQQIGESLNVSLTKEVTEEQAVKTVIDISPLENSSVFAFGYTKLKEKLVGLFGAENVVDC